MDPTTLHDELTRLERDIRDKRDQLLLDISVKIRTVFAEILAQVRQMREGIDNLIALHPE